MNGNENCDDENDCEKYYSIVDGKYTSGFFINVFFIYVVVSFTSILAYTPIAPYYEIIIIIREK